MNRRRFLGVTAGGLSAPWVFSDPVTAHDNSRLEGLWAYEFDEDEDFSAIIDLLFEFQNGAVESQVNGDSEEEAARAVAERVVQAGRPLVRLYDTSTPEALERSVNNGPRIASTDVNLIFSLLDEIEHEFDVNYRKYEHHILAASSRAFLFKSLIAASLNFYLACEDVLEADEFEGEVRANFYYSLVVLLLEVIFAKYPFDYWIAWRGTRFIHNQFLVRARSLLGPRAIAVAMKYIHWSIRAEVGAEPAADALEFAVSFLVQEGQGEAVYEETRAVIDDVGENYTLARQEAYGIETELDIEQDPVEFVATNLLEPVASTVEETKEDGQERLETLVDDVADDAWDEMVDRIVNDTENDD